jgi:hypothetical protein
MNAFLGHLIKRSYESTLKESETDNCGHGHSSLTGILVWELELVAIGNRHG